MYAWYSNNGYLSSYGYYGGGIATPAVPAAGVHAGRDVKGNITAGDDVTAVIASRAISAAISASQDVKLVQAGDRYSYTDGTDAVLSGSVHAGRTVDLVAGFGGSTSATVTADQDVGEVFSTADVSGGVTAKGHVQYVTARRDVAGAVDSQAGAVDVLAGGSISGDVSARDDVTVEALDGVSGDVTSDTGKITLTAGGDVSGALTALSDITVDTHGAVSGEINAGDPDHLADVTVTAEGGVSGPISATSSATIEAYGDVASDITAGDVDLWTTGGASGTVVGQTGDVYVSAGGDIVGSVQANLDANVWTDGGSISADVTSATGDAVVQAAGWVHGNVTAMTGVYVEAGADIVGSVTAGDSTSPASAGIYAGGSVSGPVWANGDIELEAEGDVTGPVTALQGNIDLSTTGDLRGAVSAPAGAATIEVENLSGAVVASGVVVVTANGSVFSSVTSLADAVDLHADGVVAAPVRGLGDVLVQAEGGIAGNVTAGDTGHLAHAWVFADGSLIGDVLAYGTAVVQVDGDLDGSVVAVSGDATVMAWGTVAGLIDAQAGDVLVWGGEDVTAQVEAQDEAEVDAFGHSTGAVDGEAGGEEIWEFDGLSGEESLEGEFGFTGDVVGQIRAWYDQLPEAAREQLDEGMATLLSTGATLWQSLTVLRDSYYEQVLLNSIQQTWSGTTPSGTPATWSQFTDWYSGLAPEDKELWLATLRNGLSDDNLASAKRSALASFDADVAKGAAFQADRAQWDQEIQAESQQRHQLAQTLLQELSQYKQLEAEAVTSWGQEWRQLNDQRARRYIDPRSWFGYTMDPPPARQQQIDQWLAAKADGSLRRDFEIVKQVQPDGSTTYTPVPRTDAGKARAQQWEDAAQIASMRPDQKLARTLELMVTDPTLRQELVDALGEEIVTRIKGLADPQNIATMVAVGGGISWLSSTIAAPVVIPVVGMIGYALYGYQVFDISKEFYKGVATALDAQTSDDFVAAARQLNKGVVKTAGMGVEGLGAAMGAGAAKKIGDRLKNIRKKPKQTIDGKVRVEEEGAASAGQKPSEHPAIAPSAIPGKWREVERNPGPALDLQAGFAGKEIHYRGGKAYIEEYELGGVRFDRITQDGVLGELKGDYSFLPKVGRFNPKPIRELQEEAMRQVKVAKANGLPLEWHVRSQDLAYITAIMPREVLNYVKFIPY